MNNSISPKYNVLNAGSDFQVYTELPNNNPLVLVDGRMKIAYCNDAFKEFFGIGPGEDILQVNSNHEFVNLMKGFSESRYKNISLDLNLSSQKDSEIRNYSVSVERVLLDAGQFFVLTIEALVWRKKLEDKINSLHNALDHGNVPILILDSKQRITYATHSFETLLSKEIDNIYHKDLAAIFADKLNANELSELRSAFENLMPWKKLVPFVKRTPVNYWEFSLNPVISNEGVQPSYILIANDLTEHINQTKAIERSERKQRLIINNISDLLLIIENIGTTVLFENANDNFCRTFGLDKDRIFSRKIDDFIPGELVDKIYESIKLLTKNSAPYKEFSFRDSSARDYSCKINSIAEPEQHSMIYILTMKDITDEVLYQEQLKRAYQKEMLLNKMKSDFLANMSHEIRTPFNAIVGFSEIVDESIETGDIESLQELMDSMKEVLGRAVNLFTNIVEVFQIEAGEVELDKVDLNCNHVIRNVYQKLHNDAARKNLEFCLEVDEIDCLIETDWVKFEKIIFSLVDNSIKYTEQGRVTLTSRNWGNRIEILITDTGLGIEKNDIQRLLKPFTQEVEGYTRPFEGAGLGLTLAYKLTKLLNGNFEITSEKNKGTTISLTFPVSD
ncbi:MAG: PAS domain-containing sensor histidine kinase [Melioribacteraceae bacterium]